MAILRIARMGHPVLRQVAEPVPPEQIQEPAFQALIDDMLDTLQDYEGAGLAAPQVHVSLRVIALVAEPPQPGADASPAPEPMVLINPEITFLTPACGPRSTGLARSRSAPSIGSALPCPSSSRASLPSRCSTSATTSTASSTSTAATCRPSPSSTNCAASVPWIHPSGKATPSPVTRARSPRPGLPAGVSQIPRESPAAGPAPRSPPLRATALPRS
jgi:hypothetical protein